jgi:hypothetical protein
MVTQMPTIKQDPNMTLADLKALLTEDIKGARENNNTQDNCGHLTRYVIELIKYYYNMSATKPSIPSTAASNNASTTAALGYNGRGEVVASSALRAVSGLNAILPEPPKITADLTDLSHPQVTYDLSNPPQAVDKTPVSNKDLSHQLKNLAASQGKIIFGEIALASSDGNRPGHVLAFITDGKDIICIDAQRYNGQTKTGEPCFEALETQYTFEQRIPNQVTFQSNCFYLVYGSLNHPVAVAAAAAAAEIHVKVEEPAVAVAAPANHATDDFFQFPPAITPNEIWQYLSYSHQHEIILLTPDLSIDHIKNFCALKEFKTVLLHHALLNEQIEAAANALGAERLISIHPEMPINKVLAAAHALQPGRILSLPSNISEDNIQAITAALKKETVISWDPNMARSKIQLLLPYLKPGCSIFIPARSKREKTQAAAAALPEKYSILSSPAHSLDTIQAMASSLKKDRVFLLHRHMSENQVKVAAAALQPERVLSLPMTGILHGMNPSAICSAVTNLSKGAHLLLHPDMLTADLRSAVFYLKPGRVLCVQPEMGRKKLRAAAEDLPPGTGVLLYPGMIVEKIQDVTGSLRPNIDVFLHPAMSVPEIQATTASLKAGNPLCLSPEMTIEQLHSIYELKANRTVLLHPNLSEDQIKIITAALNPGTRVLLHPEMTLESIPAAVAAIEPGCVLLLDEDMETPKIKSAVGGLNVGGLLELDPKMLLYVKLEAAASALQPGRVLSLNPLPSKEKITFLVDNLTPGVNITIHKASSIQDFLDVREIIFSRKGPNSGINILMEGHNPNEALTLAPSEPPPQNNNKRNRDLAFFGADYAGGEEKASDNPNSNP